MKRPKNCPKFTPLQMLELWLKVEENFHEHFIYGLCGVLCAMTEEGVFTKDQRDACFHDICDYSERRWGDKELPEQYSLWKMGEKKPRLALIQKMIMKYIRIQEQKPRSTWEKIKEYLPYFFMSGLCGAIWAMEKQNILSKRETEQAFEAINAERDRLDARGLYMWEPKVIELRLMFINMQLGNRPLLDLWKIVRDNFDRLFLSRYDSRIRIEGLCSIINKLHLEGVINQKEYSDLMVDLEEFGARTGKEALYFYWERGDAVARKIFINQKIMEHGKYGDGYQLRG